MPREYQAETLELDGAQRITASQELSMKRELVSEFHQSGRVWTTARELREAVSTLSKALGEVARGTVDPDTATTARLTVDQLHRLLIWTANERLEMRHNRQLCMFGNPREQG